MDPHVIRHLSPLCFTPAFVGARISHVWLDFSSVGDTLSLCPALRTLVFQALSRRSYNPSLRSRKSSLGGAVPGAGALTIRGRTPSVKIGRPTY